MINRVLLSIVFIASVVWLAIVGLDILNNKNNFDPTHLFGKKDEQLLIINRLNEVRLGQIEGFNVSPAADLIDKLNPEIALRIYLSATQNHVLLEKSTNWSVADIQRLFQDAEGLQLKEKGFSFMGYEGRYYKKDLYLRKGEIQQNAHEPITYLFDKNASASIIQFGEDVDVMAVTDIYFKNNNKQNYVTHNASIQQGKQIKDEELFAHVVTHKFDSYHFFERDFFATIDSMYQNGPMYKWGLHGFIELKYQGERIIIADYIDGQDPILILNDLQNTLDTNRFSTPLTANFPSPGNAYTVDYLEDLVVFSEKQSIVDKVLADYKLGNTIALNGGVRFQLYGNLPKSVSERYVSKDIAFSKAVYKGKLLESRIGKQNDIITTAKQETISFNTGFDVFDFEVLENTNEVVAVGKQGEVVFFAEGRKKWDQKVEGDLVGGIQLIDLHYTNETYILLNTKDQIHLWTKKGEPVSGFPVRLDTDAVGEVKFYRWKNQSYFILANDKSEALLFDSKGRELNIVKIPFIPTRKIDVWASQSTLFAGFANASQFMMYNLDDHKVHRSFALPSSCQSVKIPNELVQFSMVDNQLIKLDQKGRKSIFNNYDRGRLLGITSDKTPSLAVQSANELHLVNLNGIPFSQIPLAFNEIQDVHIHSDNSGKTTVAIIDGLENNVYLYTLSGELITGKPLEGQAKVRLTQKENTTVVTTIVDQFIVQYFD